MDFFYRIGVVRQGLVWHEVPSSREKGPQFCKSKLCLVCLDGLLWCRSVCWFGLGWFCSVLFGLVRFGLVWFDLGWFGLLRPGLVRFGLFWLDLVWPRSVWFGLVWFGSVQLGMECSPFVRLWRQNRCSTLSLNMCPTEKFSVSLSHL